MDGRSCVVCPFYPLISLILIISLLYYILSSVNSPRMIAMTNRIESLKYFGLFLCNNQFVARHGSTELTCTSLQARKRIEKETKTS